MSAFFAVTYKVSKAHSVPIIENQFAFDENGDAVFRDQEKKEKPEELEHFVLENILKEQIFEKYPGILLQPEKDFVAVVNLSEPEHDEKEIRSLLKTVEQFYF